MSQLSFRQASEVPVGVILCAKSSCELVALLQMYKGGITLARFWTELLQAVLKPQLYWAWKETREGQVRLGMLFGGSKDE